MTKPDHFRQTNACLNCKHILFEEKVTCTLHNFEFELEWEDPSEYDWNTCNNWSIKDE